MCVSMIGRITSVDDERLEARVDVDGRVVTASLVVLSLESGTPAVGDWVVMHTGFAVEVVDEQVARELLTPIPEVDNGQQVP